MSRAPLDYQTPSPMQMARRKLRRYAATVLLIGLAVGVLLALAWKRVLVRGTAHHADWITHLGPFSRELIGVAAIFAPLLIATRLMDRAKKKLLGPEVAAKAAKEQRLRKGEKTAVVRWKVPKSAEAAEWPKVLFYTVLLYGVTFVAILAFASAVFLFDRLIPSRRGLDRDTNPVHLAFSGANLVGIGLPALFILMLVFYPRVRVTLISDGLLERLGRMKNLIPYSSIREVRIGPSRRRRSLKCVAILATDDRFGERWHRFDLGHDAPVGEIVKAFQAKGFSVAIDQSGDPTEETSGGRIRS